MAVSRVVRSNKVEVLESPSVGKGSDTSDIFDYIRPHCLGGGKSVRDAKAAAELLATRPVERTDTLSFLLTLLGAASNTFFVCQALYERPDSSGRFDLVLMELIVVWAEFIICAILWVLLAAKSLAQLTPYRIGMGVFANDLFALLKGVAEVSVFLFIVIASERFWKPVTGIFKGYSGHQRSKHMGSGPNSSAKSCIGALVLISVLAMVLGLLVVAVGLSAMALYVKVSLLQDVTSTAPADWTWDQGFRFFQFMQNVISLVDFAEDPVIAAFLFAGGDTEFSAAEAAALKRFTTYVQQLTFVREGFWAAMVRSQSLFSQDALIEAFVVDERDGAGSPSDSVTAVTVLSPEVVASYARG